MPIAARAFLLATCLFALCMYAYVHVYIFIYTGQDRQRFRYRYEYTHEWQELKNDTQPGPCRAPLLCPAGPQEGRMGVYRRAAGLIGA